VDINEEDLYEDDPEFERLEGVDADKKEKKGDGIEEEDNYSDYMEDSLNMAVKSPKQSLIDHLRLLTDIFNSSLDGASDYYD
jgi:hypothetical protein